MDGFGQIALNNALVWFVTGDTYYANRAVTVLNRYKNIHSVKPYGTYPLDASKAMTLMELKETEQVKTVKKEQKEQVEQMEQEKVTEQEEMAQEETEQAATPLTSKKSSCLFASTMRHSLPTATWW